MKSIYKKTFCLASCRTGFWEHARFGSVSRGITGQSMLQINSAKVIPIESAKQVSSLNDDNKDADGIEHEPRQDTQRGRSSSSHFQNGITPPSDAGETNTNEDGSALSSTLKNIIEEAAAAGKKLRFRLLMCTTVFGLVVMLVLFFINVLINMGVLSERTFGPPYVYRSLLIPSMLFAILGVMPNDAITIRVLTVVVLILALGFSMLFGCQAGFDWFVNRHEISDYSDEKSNHQRCGADLPDAGCAVLVIASGMNSLVMFLVAIASSRNLVRIKGQKIYDSSRLKGFRYMDHAFKVPSRAALERLWTIGRVYFGYFGVNWICAAIADRSLSSNAPWYSTEEFANGMVSGSINILLVMIITPTRRRRFMAFLTSMAVDDRARAAASIAALIGGANANSTLELASGKFRSISLTHVHAEDFDDVTKSEGNTDALYRQTVCRPLGTVDVFISHSWHDHGRKKFKALQDWAQDFENQTGRPPKFWLDKACIDQADIATNLLCLPIFVGGCKKLLILAGPTYIERLWCVLEVFVFLQMGGKIEQIEILLIDMENKNNTASIFQAADINNCKCFLDSDKQLILGIVQQGFGSFDAFNATLRDVFEKRTIRNTTGNANSQNKTSFQKQAEKYEVPIDTQE